MPNVERPTNKFLTRTLQVVELLAHAEGHMRLRDIAEKTKITDSTALRILNTLAEGKYVEQDGDSRRYSLTMKFAHIGNLIASKISIRDVARPFLVGLCQRTKESASLIIEQNSTAVYIDSISGPENIFRTLHLIGKAAPLHCTAAGKCLMLNYSSQEIERYVQEIGLSPLTNKSIKTKEQLVREIGSAATRGYAVDDEECEDGVRCVAAPIRDYMAKVVASISVTGPSSRLTKTRVKALKDMLMETAGQIAGKLG
ncbi:MAG: IclR family transcriptional regulator [Candidatus Atribacteria bacterium]|nr:IclR family transcriptional regulator [Candidatus Atribacteria bacterium]